LPENICVRHPGVVCPVSESVVSARVQIDRDTYWLHTHVFRGR